MRRSSDPIARCVHILMMLPRAPRKMAARAIHARLVERGIHVTMRTIERDLHRLRSAVPIELDSVHKPYGWAWDRDAQALLGA